MPLIDMDKLILITNDDGIDAPGIKYLTSFLKSLGHLVVVAPETPMSGMGHAVTIRNPLRTQKVGEEPGIERHVTSGTPADCVKLALHSILKRKPDLIVSGINHGSNHSINILYSGTMAAAIEGAMQNIPSIGFSMFNHDPKIDFGFMEPWISDICQRVMAHGLPNGVCLNVNFPDSTSPLGMRICRQSIGYWDEGFEKRTDVHQQPYYWLKGDFIVSDGSQDTDHSALMNHYISMVPVSIDLTAHQHLKMMNQIFEQP